MKDSPSKEGFSTSVNANDSSSTAALYTEILCKFVQKKRALRLKKEKWQIKQMASHPVL